MSINDCEEKREIIERKLEIPDFALKHPLQHTWTLWYFENDRQKTWEENQREIVSFATIEDFWSVYSHIKMASELRQGCDYSLFKSGIRPMWEDDANKHGGKWAITMDKKQRTNDLDRFWLDTLLCLIGEAFENSDDVCGAVVNVRAKWDKIGVWTKDASHCSSVMEIGWKLKERLRIAPKIQIGYHTHKDAMAKSGSSTKSSYVV